MIEHYLSNKNERATVAQIPKFRELNTLLYGEIKKKNFWIFEGKSLEKNTRVEGEAIIESWQGCSY